MKRITAAFLVLTSLCGMAYGASTCVHSGSAVFTVKKTAAPISGTYSASERTFSVTFDYDLYPAKSGVRTLTGMSSCNAVNTDTSGGTITSGAANTHLRASSSDVGDYCWCSFTGPITTWWVFLKRYTDGNAEDTCASNCTADCYNAIMNDTIIDGKKFRSQGMFNGIW